MFMFDLTREADVEKEIRKTKAVKNIEGLMEDLDPSSLRYEVLESAKQFKSSWIRLGQSLFAVWRDKHYKEWGFSEFDGYAKKEIGIRPDTALKLLRSYNFLKKEEPVLLQKQFNGELDAAKSPTYETVDVIRKASRRKDLLPEDYDTIKKDVLEKGKDHKTAASIVKKYVLKDVEKDNEQPPEAIKARKIKRLLRFLTAIRDEIEGSEIVPQKLGKDIDRVLKEIEDSLLVQ